MTRRLRRFFARRFSISRDAPVALPHPCQRRNERSEVLSLSRDFFERQKSLIRDRLIPAIRDNPELELANRLADPEYAEFGERVVEYGWVAKWLLGFARRDPGPRLLDVGCVMNNAVIADVVMECCSAIYLMNPSPEAFAYSERAGFILADCRRHFLSDEETFPIVTCFSTLEHVGMNNLRYGGDAGEVTSAMQHPEEVAKSALQSLFRLTAPNGSLALSVPFGPFEYLYVVGDARPIHYTFDRERLLNFLGAIDLPIRAWNIEIYKVVPGWGWMAADLADDNILPYAKNCVGAGAVAIVSVTKPA